MAKSKVSSERVQRAAPSKLMLGLTAQAHSRPEGSAIERSEIERNPDGSVRYAVNLNTAPVPQRRYVADTAAVSYNGYEINIVFGQTKIYGEGFESALSIKINLNAFNDLVGNLYVTALPDVLQTIEQLKLKSERLTNMNSEPTHSAKLIANVANCALSGHETCIDFYHINAFAHAKVAESDKVDIEAVVRVDLRTSLFAPFCTELGKIAQRIAAGE